MSGRVYLFFPARGHEPSPTLRDRLNPHYGLKRRRFPISRYAKRPDDALYAIGSLFLLPTPSSPHFPLNVSKHCSLLQPPAAHLDESVPAHKSLLVRNFVSILSHRVISRARLYEVIRWYGLLRCATMMRNKTW